MAETFEDPETQALVAELTAFIEAYQAAEAAGEPVHQVTHAGWRPRARSARRLLVHKDSGADAAFEFENGQPRLREIIGNGNEVDFSERPYTIWSKHPTLTGAVAPEVARLELVGPDHTVRLADVVAGTFAVDTELDLSSERALAAKEAAGPVSVDERIEAIWAASAEAGERLREFRIRVRDEAGSVLCEGDVVYRDEVV